MKLIGGMYARIGVINIATTRWLLGLVGVNELMMYNVKIYLMNYYIFHPEKLDLSRMVYTFENGYNYLSTKSTIVVIAIALRLGCF
ncbi:hypothetical protein [Periweissella cryptocerci]|uniref:hypothetical protein n=1 Tax=Periweissella cryptocerci TaxID=2506420 RepID=UPI001404FE22|nr:hypothetical protein [Periweissella cryptocerci]